MDRSMDACMNGLIDGWNAVNLKWIAQLLKGFVHHHWSGTLNFTTAASPVESPALFFCLSFRALTLFS